MEDNLWKWIEENQNYLEELQRKLEKQEQLLRGKDRMSYNDPYGVAPRKTVQGNVDIPGVNILPQNERAGHDDRVNAIEHVSQMAEKGYLRQEEANQRIKHIEDTEQKSVLRILTSDLPAKIYEAPRFDWNKPGHFLPVLVGGMGLSAGFAATIPTVLNFLHLFPNTALGMGLGIPALVAGIAGFFICLVMIIVKAPD